MEKHKLAKLLAIPELVQHLADLDNRLLQLSAQTSTLSPTLNQIISSGGKRLRPVLLIAIVASQRQEVNDEIISAAAAIELVHLASLIHDDVIDNSQRRRQGLSANKSSGLAIALLSGDYLLALACSEAAKVSSKLAQLVSNTVATMCLGQAQQLAQGRVNTNDYLQIIDKKTASLFRLAAQVGGLYGGLSPTDLDKATLYGSSFGMSFQIVDDVIDNETGGVSHIQAMAKIREYNLAANQVIQTLPGRLPIIQGLAKLPGSYLEWAL